MSAQLRYDDPNDTKHGDVLLILSDPDDVLFDPHAFYVGKEHAADLIARYGPDDTTIDNAIETQCPDCCCCWCGRAVRYPQSEGPTQCNSSFCSRQ